ncbi:hypothetical protein DXV75_13530 [Alteromonas aestuariivivens]|uniref:Solute-binding protein family 3/N-terminal domain-containing protein n=1 Tax=Alteromonas aestuariivivens TaxID=1938339 RepID=A0A3D8M5L4_9ALTE|nr:transporter substrate-binding domain-containing protein [Alteromonas aestuariivivens]RDV24442.1 hypothetical protein DXV75_13530 [Alteromonas aestuariivivens]
MRSVLCKLMTGLVIGACLTMQSVFACELRIPDWDVRYSIRNDYAINLLQELLKRTETQFEPCTIVKGPYAPPIRLTQQLAENQNYDVAWMPVTLDNSARLKMLPYPIDKGSLGWRVLLIRKADQSHFAKVKTLDDLRQYRAGFHELWSDYNVYQHNLDEVIGFRDYQSMFTMLHHQRYDYVSRALHEAIPELTRSHEQNEVQLEQSLLLHYPNGDFFFVNKSNTRLAERLEKGFQLIIEDGTFDRMFNGFYGSAMSSIKLSGRRVINLENPQFPLDILNQHPELWLHYEENRLQ